MLLRILKKISGVFIWKKSEPLKEQMLDDYFDLQGKNWTNEKNNKPIAILWGFNVWKREYVASFLPEYRVAFIRGKTPWKKITTGLKLVEGNNYFIFWGKPDSHKKREQLAYKYAKRKKIKIFRMEDGFIRSIGLGANHIQPLSLVLDKSGIYYDSGKESDLEKLTTSLDFSLDNQLIDRAKKCISFINNNGISKYNYKSSNNNDEKNKAEHLEKSATKKTILVIGQVDDDASITHGCKKRITSNELVQIVRNENPAAKILYKPHPEFLAGFKKNQENYLNAEHLCDEIIVDKSLSDSLQGVDHVYTITSLAGFEALLRGIKVTTLGSPFYSGWGLTDDREKITRRRRKLSLNELFASAYIRYPRYLCPLTETEILIEQALINLNLMQSYLFSDFFYSGLDRYQNINETITNGFIKNSDLAAEEHKIQSNIESLLGKGEKHPIINLFCEIIKESIRKKTLLEISKISNNKACIKLLWPIANHYRKLVKFNTLREALNEFIFWFEDPSNHFSIEDNINFYEALNSVLKLLNGRIVKNIPFPRFDINNNCVDIRESLQISELTIAYIRSLSYYCEYIRIEDIIINNDNINYNFWFKITAILSEKTIRSEKDGFKRDYLKRLCARTALRFQNKKFHKTLLDFKINQIRYYTSISEVDEVENISINLIKLFKDKKLKNSIFYRTHNVLGRVIYPRLNELAIPANLLLKHNRSNSAKKLYQILKHSLSPLACEELRYRIILADKGTDCFIKNMSSNPSISRQKSLAISYSRALRDKSYFQSAKKILLSTASATDTNARIHGIQEEAARLDFLTQTSEIINSYSQPSLPSGIVALCSLSCLNTLAILAPVLAELKKNGYVIIHLSEGMLDNQTTCFKDVNKLAGSIKKDYLSNNGQLINTWEIDWSSEKVVSCGINFYQGIFESLSSGFRRFEIDINNPAISSRFKTLLYACDLMLDACNRVNKFVLKSGLPLVFLGGNSHVAPFSVFRDYSLSLKSKKIFFSAVNIAYENYYTNLGSSYSSSMAVVDMTSNPTCRAPFLPISSRFESWYKINKNSSEVKDRVESLVTVNRALRDDKSISKTLSKIENASKNNVKVICCFGKILCDLGVPFDGGNAHKNIIDWLNHTIKTVSGDDKILLLIKPHPHELRPEIALDLVDFIGDYIPKLLPKNVILLDHNEFNTADIAAYLDLAILWNGTSSLELITMGVPVMMCSYFGAYDYPIDFIYPKSRIDYENLVLDKKISKPGNELKKRAAAILYYMGTKDVALPNAYCKRPVTNDKTGVPTWDHKAVSNYFMQGDEYIKTAASRIIEGIENSKKNATNGLIK
jgi:hypothetical protein